MWIVKLGGSLARDPLLRDWLQALRRYGGGRVVVVPGGGGFAGQVRAHQAQWAFDDLVAHNMAVLAMVQYGMMMQGLCPALSLAHSEEEVRRVLRDDGVAVWLPYALLREAPDAMTNWDVTSDSIAAWLASRLGAERLLLVKACEVDARRTPAEQVERGVVDQAFPRFVRDGAFVVEIVNKATCMGWEMGSVGLPSMSASPVIQEDRLAGRFAPLSR